MAFLIFLVFVLFLQGAHGEIICEELPVGMCSFSIASTAKRCLLETYSSDDGIVNLQCKTSEVVVQNMHEYIETDECINACGLDRISFGISSDSLAEPQSITKLCSQDCYQNCPNVVDLYSNLAVAEGSSLSYLCKKQQIRSRRALRVVNPGGASGPISAAAAAAPFSAAEGPVSAAAPVQS